MKRIAKLLVCACALLLAVLLAGCGAEQADAETDTQKQEPELTIRTAEKQEETDSPESLSVNTDYGTLFYPAQWADLIQTEAEAAGDTIVVSFSTAIGEKTYPLFKVTIGGTEGAEVGQLTDREGTKRTVYMSMDEIEEDPGLTGEERDRLYTMQEDLNYLIDHLK